jgi:hypothetical protein
MLSCARRHQRRRIFGAASVALRSPQKHQHTATLEALPELYTSMPKNPAGRPYRPAAPAQHACRKPLNHGHQLPKHPRQRNKIVIPLDIIRIVIEPDCIPPARLGKQFCAAEARRRIPREGET